MEQITREQYIERLRPICDALEQEGLALESNWVKGAELVAEGLRIIGDADVIDPAFDTEFISKTAYLTLQMHKYGVGERANDETKRIMDRAWRENVLPHA